MKTRIVALLKAAGSVISLTPPVQPEQDVYSGFRQDMMAIRTDFKNALSACDAVKHGSTAR